MNMSNADFLMMLDTFVNLHDQWSAAIDDSNAPHYEGATALYNAIEAMRAHYEPILGVQLDLFIAKSTQNYMSDMFSTWSTVNMMPIDWYFSFFKDHLVPADTLSYLYEAGYRTAPAQPEPAQPAQPENIIQQSGIKSESPAYTESRPTNSTPAADIDIKIRT